MKHPPVASADLTYLRQNFKVVVGGKLLLITNRKSHMGFRLVPKSVTLNDLKGRNGLILRYFVKFGSFRGTFSKSG